MERAVGEEGQAGEYELWEATGNSIIGRSLRRNEIKAAGEPRKKG